MVAIKGCAARNGHEPESVAGATHTIQRGGPKKLKAKCEPTSSGATCEVTAYARPQAIYSSSSAPYSVAIASETWTVPTTTAGQFGKPRRTEGDIAGFLESDNVFNCSGGESLNC